MKYRATHLAQLERWLGSAGLAQLQQSSVGVRYPIPVLNIPGKVFAHDGDFYGMIAGGAGFSSLSDLIDEATTNGKRQDGIFAKIGTLAVNNSYASLWNVGAMPGAGGAPASRPGGAVPTNATVGGLQQIDPAGSDTLHFTTAFAQGSAAPNTLLLYDRLFHAAAINHNTASAQTITGVPTRYLTSDTPPHTGAGNFAFLEVTTVLTATVHNLTMQYCVDELTECLTKRGWKRYNEIGLDDELLAWSPELNGTRWEKPREIFINKNYSGDMTLLGERELSALVTPDHRWPIETRGRYGAPKRFKVCRTYELPSDGYLLRSANYLDAPTKKIYSDSFVRLVAWYMAEGSRQANVASISQSHEVNPLYVEEIRADIVSIGAQPSQRQKGKRGSRLRREGLFYSEGVSDDTTKFLLSGRGTDDLFSVFGEGNKVISPEFILNLTPDQLDLFIDTLQKGDGTPERKLFYQHDSARMAMYTMAATLAGYCPTVDEDGSGCALKDWRQGKGKGRTHLGKLRKQPLHYVGPIWCPVLPSKHWVARRNGKVFITGNTDQAGNAAENAPALAGIISSAVGRIPHTPWFIPLNAADTGMRTVTQITFSAAAASGVSNLVMGHPLAFLPCPVANSMMVLDGINSAFNLVRILSGACLAFLEMKGVGTATTYNGQVIMVSG